MLIAAVPACAAPGAQETATAEATTPAPVPTQETPASPPDDDNLANTEWTLESFGPMGAETPVLEGTTVTLMFESGGQAGGSGGCNSYGTDYQVQDNSLIFGEIVSTLMACIGEGITEQEQLYLTALRSAGEFEQTADQLIIHYDNGQSVLNFSATNSVAETPTPSEDGENSLVGTQWQLESFGPPAAEMLVVEGSMITLEFETAEQAVGSGGCNSYGGDYTVQGDTISFGQIVSTEIACLDQAVTEQEQRYFEALQTAGSFAQTAEQLTISYNNGQSVLNFVPATSSNDGSSSGESFPPEDPVRIAFEPSETSAEVSDTIEEHNTHYYVLRALEGQEMMVEITSPNNDVVLTIVTEDGMPIKRYQNGPPASWTGTLPDSQDYYIYAISFGPDTSYTLTVQVDPL